MNRSWKLKIGDQILGALTEDAFDMPSMLCKFVAAPSFDEYAPLFADELRLLNADEMVLWDVAYSKIDALGLILESDDEPRELIKDFILHVDGDTAWFRS
jgi:hypothetical protein